MGRIVEKNTCYKGSELDNCNSVKAILMLCVVFCHSMAIYMSGGWGPFEAVRASVVFRYLADWIGSFHVFGFTLVSGYIFYYVKYERGGYRSYLPFLVTKAKRLLVPYIFVVSIWVIPVYVYFYGFDFNEILTRYILGESPNQLWFLLMLFWVFLIFWPISDYAKEHLFGGGVIVLVLLALGIGLVFVPNVYVLRTGLQYIVYFWIGFLIRQYSSKCLMKIPTAIYLVVDLILLVAYEVLGTMSGVLAQILSIGVAVILHSVGAVMAFVILQRVVNYMRNNWVIKFFSKHSMGIFLFHQQIIYFVLMFSNSTRIPSLITVLLNFVISVSVASVISWVMSKTKFTRFLIGSK